MIEIVLKPEQIIVPGETDIGNENILKIYFSIFNRGHGGDLPPVLVIREGLEEYTKSFVEEVNANCEKGRFYRLPWRIIDSFITKGGAIKEVKRLTSKFRERPTSFTHFLIDGNHRTMAAALTHQPINALELQMNEDLQIAREMVERGTLFEFYRDENTIRSLRNEFINYCFEHIDSVMTVAERAKVLASEEGDLPEYIRQRYFSA